MDHSQSPEAIQRRFQQALDLYELAEAMVRQRLKRENPDADEAFIEAGVIAWRLHRPGAENGDAPGRVVPWPRS
jgi:hypothetical protein